MSMFDRMSQQNGLAGGKIITPKSGFICLGCGDEPMMAPSPPNPPGRPVGMVTSLDTEPVGTFVPLCMPCYIRGLRGAVPQLVPLSMLPEEQVAQLRGVHAQIHAQEQGQAAVDPAASAAPSVASE